jgi:Na+-translocating ferredoxin:NAD+ oxidoreductase RnfC subunit
MSLVHEGGSNDTRAGAEVLVRAGAAGLTWSLEPAAVVIASACEGEPLFGADRAVLLRETDRVVRGLGAALLATGAERAMIAVFAQDDAAARAARAATRRTNIAVLEVPHRLPLATDLGVAGALVLPARALVELDGAVLKRPPAARWLTIAGAVVRPRVTRVPAGATVGQVVDPLTPAYVTLTAALGGDRLDFDDVIDARVLGLLVLPHDHTLVRWRAAARSTCPACAKGAPALCPTGLHPTGPHPRYPLELPAAPAPDATSRGLPLAAALARLGLTDYARPLHCE